MSDYINKVNVDGEEYDVNDSRISLPLSVGNGGTGQTTAPNAANALLSSLPSYTLDPTDNLHFIREDRDINGRFGIATFSTIWNYIKSKILAGVYWANLTTSDAASYVTQPEFKEVKINGLTTSASASTENCVMQYDTTDKCVKFVFN